MGAEAMVNVTVNGATHLSKVRLETSVLHIRGADLKLDVRFAEMKKVAVRDGTLSFMQGRRVIELMIGAAAAKWADKILNPPSRLSRIGVKPDWRASIVGAIEPGFLQELKGVVADLAVGRAVRNSDAIFLAVDRVADLKKIESLKCALKPDGAFWIVRPKGHREITERGVMDAGKAAGLVDVKVVGFSSTHTAEKFVIPLKDRPNASRPKA